MRRIVFLAAALALFAPGLASAAGDIPEIHKEPLADRDARTETVAPTDAQRAAVDALDADVTWNAFGTPATLTRHDGWLATGVAGSDAAGAARNWLAANAALFRLSSTDGLRLVNDAELKGSDGHAVLFRQRFGALDAVEDGQVTVGLARGDGGWNVAFVSSSLAGDAALAAAPALTAQEAWTKAAGDVGRAASIVFAGSARTHNGWQVFGVRGWGEYQRARLGALPTPGGGVRPVWETLLVDNPAGAPTAYTHYVDAATGEILVRHNLVHRSHQPATTFTGTVPAVDGACDVKGPYVVGPSENVRSIDVLVEATLTTNDSVINLRRDGVTVASGDTLFSPEALHYAPGAGVPAGTYTIAVCDYVDGHAWDDPRTYAGQAVFNSVAATGLAYPPRWRVFPASPPLPTGPYGSDLSDTDTRQTWCWDSEIGGTTVSGCDREVQNLASRAPWDVSPRLDGPTYTTIGNNAHTGEAWVNAAITPGATGYRPVSFDRSYVYGWRNAWEQSRCSPTEFVPGTGNDISAATTNLFVQHNRMHDWAYSLGFTEETWNAQESNFGTGGTHDGDPLLGDVQAGAVSGGSPSYLGRDNANMVPLPDGVPPITNMYLWQPLRGAFYAPCVDGDYDMAVVGHEYGHLIEVRMIGKGGSRSGHHAGAMGESHSDLMAMEYLNEYGFVPVQDENPYAVGAYATGNKERGIRNFAMNESPLNFSDMGYDITGPQVHADGEIWSATQFDVRRALVAKYGSADPATQVACADGKLPASSCPGNRRWIQLMFDAYLLMPVAPTMLQARDAMLAADRLRFGAANQAEIWLAFARRGFGEGARSSNTNANTDIDPTPDFASPHQSEAAVTFAAVDATDDSAVAARVYVGRYEARVSPIADTDPATTVADAKATNNLDATAAFVPGTYEFVVAARGYGHLRLTRTFKGGENTTLKLTLARNLASGARGASASGDGARHADLIDDTEATNWEAAGGPVAGRQVTVDLAGDAAHTIGSVQVSALLRPGQNRFTALRAFEIWTSTDGTTFTQAFTSASDAFPGAAPRPVSPQMLLRSFALPAQVRATHVRLVVLDNQCTGQPQFHGTQDNDPTNPTDCRSSETDPATLPPRDTAVVAAELQVFGVASVPGRGSGGGPGGGNPGGGGGGGGSVGRSAPAPSTPAPAVEPAATAAAGVAGVERTQRSVSGQNLVRGAGEVRAATVAEGLTP